MNAVMRSPSLAYYNRLVENVEVANRYLDPAQDAQITYAFHPGATSAQLAALVADGVNYWFPGLLSDAQAQALKAAGPLAQQFDYAWSLRYRNPSDEEVSEMDAPIVAYWRERGAPLLARYEAIRAELLDALRGLNLKQVST